jgi:glycosyltransferase involved in cell wall biosynthesis
MNKTSSVISERMNLMRKSYSLFFYEGYVGVAPTIINLAKIIYLSKHSVTIYATKNDYPPPGDIGKDVEIFYFHKEFKILNFLRETQGKIFIKFKGLVPLIKAIVFAFQSLLIQSNKAKNTVNIGVDLYGSIAALINSYIYKQKFLYLSLELEQKPADFKGVATLVKKLANRAYQNSEAIIIQDEERFNTLSEYYQYHHPKVFYLPNSPLALTDKDLDVNTTNFFREKLNFTQEEFPHIVLQAGMVNDTVCAKSLAKAFASIHNGCALIFHERNTRQEDDLYIESLRQLNSKNLFLSLEPVPYDQIDSIYRSSTIGLTFYKPPKNRYDDFAKIASASGKLPQYLKHGKPVLVSNLPSLSKLINQYQCGIVIENPEDANEIKSALDQIISHYSTYSSNAKTCFEAEFDFGKKMEPVLSFMESL